MANFFVNPKELEEQARRLKALASEGYDLENNFAAIRNGLDWDIRSRDNIDEDMREISRELGNIMKRLRNTSTFLYESKTSYEEAERILAKKASKLNETLDLLTKPIEKTSKIIQNTVKISAKGIPPLEGTLSYNPKEYNPYVEQLQKRLNELGYTDTNGNILVADGRFGNRTLEAVNKYKEQNQLWNTGIYAGKVGNTTWQHIFENDIQVDLIDKNKANEALPPLEGTLSYNPKEYNPYVEQLQKRLNELGYTDTNGNILVADGRFGNRTLEAVNKYKEQNQLWNTGIYAGKVGNTTWQHLFENDIRADLIGKNKPEVSLPTGESYVNKDLLKQLGWHNITDKMVKDLNNVLVKYDITTPERIRHFISQCMQESDLGRATVEYGSDTYFLKYEGRKDLGNVKPGDGPKYRGAGYIQLTGRYNYQAFADYMGDPRIMEGYSYVSEKYPWEAAGYFWKMKNMNAIIDNGTTVLQVSKKVNGVNSKTGLPNHYENREKYYELCCKLINYNNKAQEGTAQGEKTGEGLSFNNNAKLIGVSSALPIIPKVVNDGVRSAANYTAVIDQFDLSDKNSRYKPGDGKTYCNIFLWDVTLAMGAEIPHWVKRGTNDPYTYNHKLTYQQNCSNAKEMNANMIADWLKNVGSKYGWRAVSTEEAQAAANLGKPTVGAWHNPEGIGHVVIVRPNLSGDGEIHIAQAGASNYSDGKLSEHKSSKFKKGVIFYVHD